MTREEGYFISVVICTYNNVNLLKRCLNAILDQTLGKEEYEVLVIDNNCNDNTVEYVKNLLPKHKNLKYFLEPMHGIGAARNRGVDESRGEIITFIDDDAIAEKNFVEVIRNKFRYYPSIFCLGGKVLPKIEFEVPTWMLKKYNNYLVLTYDVGQEDRFLGNPSHGPAGANMSFKSIVFHQFGKFDVRLGRSKKKYLANEEEKLLHPIKRIEKACLFTPEAVVHHIAKESRVGRIFLLHRAYYKGVSDARSGYKPEQIIHPLARPLLGKAKTTIRDFLSDIRSLFYKQKVKPGMSDVARETFFNLKENLFGELVMTIFYKIGVYLEKFRLFLNK